MEEAFPQVGEDAPLSLISSLLTNLFCGSCDEKGRGCGHRTKADLLPNI